MKLPLQVVFRDVPKSEAAEAAIRKHPAKTVFVDSKQKQGDTEDKRTQPT